MASASITAVGVSDWIDCTIPVTHRLDIDVPGTISAISCTIESTHNQAGQAKTLRQPHSVTTAWEFTASDACNVTGGAFYRLRIASMTGSGTVALHSREVETT